MCRSLFHCFIFFCGFLACSWRITPQESAQIGNQIYVNECSGKKEKLVWWNEGEDFASLGIGHFIWYPKEKKGPFEETFPLLLTFLKGQGVDLPDWLKSCPWDSKQEFLNDTKRLELQTFLSKTIPLQAAFIVQRFEQAVPKFPPTLIKKMESVGQTAQGKYALIDFLNFKGEGTAETERYCGQGWGLKQVLEEMPDHAQDPLLAFSETAKKILKRRVQNAPQERREERWLPGWLARIDTYLKS